MSFANKVVIVTGGSAGIGAATVLEFAKEGAKVVIVGRNEDNLKKVADQCKSLNADFLIVKADVTKKREAENIVEATVKKYGQLDILVNNAGIVKLGSLLDGRMVEIYDDIMNTNLKSIVVLTSLAAPYLVKTKGNIINISSVAGSDVGTPAITTYSISKAALNMFTIGTALEMAPHGVRVNAVSPGPVKTDILKSGGLDIAMESLAVSTALGRISDVKEVADLILFLASEKAKGITGSNYVCDNGSLIYKK